MARGRTGHRQGSTQRAPSLQSWPGGVCGQEEPHQRWNIQEYLQAGIFGRRQMLALQTAAPFEGVAASSCLLLPLSCSHRVPRERSRTCSAQSEPGLPKSARGGARPGGCSAAPTCCTSVFWPLAMGSPWQPLPRSCGPASLMPTEGAAVAVCFGEQCKPWPRCQQAGKVAGSGEGYAAEMGWIPSCVQPRVLVMAMAAKCRPTVRP